MNFKTILFLSLILSLPVIAQDWGRELDEATSDKSGTITLGAITSATGGYMIAKGLEKTIVGNTGCNYPASFIARSFRGCKTRSAGIILALAGLATFDVGATFLTEPQEGMKFYRNFSSKTFQSISLFFSLFSKSSNSPKNND